MAEYKVSLPNAAQIDDMNAYLTQLCINTGGPHEVETWSEIQAIVRQGLASNYFNVGDQFKVTKGTQELIFDVLGFDYDTPSDTNLTHSMTLGLHDVFTYGTISFDATEAFYYASADMSAGTYHFTIGAQPWYAADVGKTVQFTLTSSVSAGAQFVLSNSYNATMVGANVLIYNGPTSITAAQTCVISEGSTGNDLGTINNAKNGQLNSIQRALLGNNNYAESGHRQFLNSDAAAVTGVQSWWSAKNNWDRPQTSSIAGFLNGLDTDFVAVLGKVKKRTALNTVSDGGGYSDTDELIFSQSRAEIFGSAENSVWETSFGTDGLIKTVAYPYWQDSTNWQRIKKQINTTTKRYYWMRSPGFSVASYARFVYTDGSLTSTNAYDAIGVVPACVIV